MKNHSYPSSDRMLVSNIAPAVNDDWAMRRRSFSGFLYIGHELQQRPCTVWGFMIRPWCIPVVVDFTTLATLLKWYKCTVKAWKKHIALKLLISVMQLTGPMILSAWTGLGRTDSKSSWRREHSLWKFPSDTGALLTCELSSLFQNNLAALVLCSSHFVTYKDRDIFLRDTNFHLVFYSLHNLV